LGSHESVDLTAEDAVQCEEFTHATPGNGHLELDQTEAIDIVAKFCGLGQRALPFMCQVTGGSYTCAVVANVSAPKLKLHTELIDFSADFKICNRSWADVYVTNECGVLSTVRLVMVDDCNHVFSLEDTEVKDVITSVTIRVSCYSEIHGDYNGMLKLIVKDPWQYKEIKIPLHVKALGSFFGFQKHILGYVSDVDGDYITFGQNIPLSERTVIRRLTLENFSSEAITVDWSISNFVKNRHYADLALDVGNDGKVSCQITEAGGANRQEPFRLLSEQTVIESHGKTVVIVEFTPKEFGEFRGCVAARSGEFMHTVGICATVPQELPPPGA
jgi:hypothetical protein